MQWSEFKALPEDLQTEYLRKLDERFHVGCVRLSRMFGVSAETTRKVMHSAGLELNKNKQMTNSDRATWELWLSGENNTKTPAASSELREKPESSTKAKANVEDTDRSVEHESLILKNGVLTLEGTAEELSEAITSFLLRESRRCRIVLGFDFD